MSAFVSEKIDSARRQAVALVEPETLGDPMLFNIVVTQVLVAMLIEEIRGLRGAVDELADD